MVLNLYHVRGLRRRSLLITLITMAVLANKPCFSFLFFSRLPNKSSLMKSLESYHRSFVSCNNLDSSSTKVFSSHAFSSHNQNGAFTARSSTFSTLERDISKEESEKLKDLTENSKLQLAPMMEYTDRHFRHLVRLISGKTLLYTEMVAANALAHERKARIEEYKALADENGPISSAQDIRANYSDQYLQRYLNQGRMQPLEGPSVLQLGGSDPSQLYEAAQTVMDMTYWNGLLKSKSFTLNPSRTKLQKFKRDRGHCDYTALNLNCGCPSPKVAGKGCFGAALMDDPKLVAELANAMHDGCDRKLPVTVKCRIGTDTHEPFTKDGYAELDSELEYSRLCNFIETVASNSPVTDFSVHARIAVLRKSFSPADNRKVPPLKYEIVRRLANDYPELKFTLNGGVDTLSQAYDQLNQCPELSGVMIGRGFAADPWGFALADSLLYKNSDTESNPPKNRLEVLTEYGKHADAEEEHGDPTKIRRFITKAVTTLFTAEPNAKRYRIALDEIGGLPKKLEREGKSLSGQPLLSELILNAAHTHLSEEVLLKSPEESYEEKLYHERKTVLKSGRSSAVLDWQLNRVQEQQGTGSIY